MWSMGDRRRLIVVSNRGPVSYSRQNGERVASRGGGGLVTALRGLVSHHDVTWMASAITDALWKTRPTVAGRVGDMVRQIQDGETGWLVDSPAECAEACIEVLRDPADARLRALKGKEYVRRNFLMPRLLRDWLVLFNRLLGNDTAGAELAVVGAA